ncbi:MAG: HD domain-containing protein, partial [Nocardioidaceae bacterium]
ALPEPWSDDARDLLVRLLAAGPGLLPVWETLDETGALGLLLPEWERVRLLPHASVVHRFTVDRHLVETCIEASRLIRRVPRPDLLVVAALVHDIGKGGRQEHSVAGSPIAAGIAARLGFEAVDVEVVADLVRWHLLLSEVATTRDLEDPATVQHVLDRVGDPRTLDLLAVLTEADARATSPKAWTTWRASLVRDLVARARAAAAADGPEQLPVWEPVEVPAAVRGDMQAIDVRVETGVHGSEVTVVACDRVGLLAAVAGMFGVQRISIRSARAWTQDEYAFSHWHVDDTHLEAAGLRPRLEAILDGRVDVGERLRRTAGRNLDPSVAVRPEASRHATVLEVRVDDRPGVVHLVCQALADIDVAVRSAHVTTFGPQAVDVFYVQEEGAGALADDRAAEAAHAVRRVLTDTVTLDA